MRITTTNGRRIVSIRLAAGFRQGLFLLLTSIAITMAAEGIDGIVLFSGNGSIIADGSTETASGVNITAQQHQHDADANGWVQELPPGTAWEDNKPLILGITISSVILLVCILGLTILDRAKMRRRTKTDVVQCSNVHAVPCRPIQTNEKFGTTHQRMAQIESKVAL
ncbi:unnamed protein product [Pseudo-nitzschia multistriata]|uniref:Uncharacterized protein n=1 Tax=Pseudo-nitzschia multistriata TaxID=183589 RepID=A0A448Z4N3_9STRA|nr:unnamed protein product [Pseudo-nitzschia multistriata]